MFTPTHGMSRSTEYHSWHGMKQRCLNPSNPAFIHYGARGIAVSPSWIDSFESFLADVGPSPGKGFSIDRINNDGPYCKENCRWVTMEEQSNNRRTNSYITYRGERLTWSKFSKLVGMSRAVLRRRIVGYGWDVERAVSTPVKILAVK